MSAVQTTPTRLTVTIITKNEAHHIAACIESVKFADEIIVVDSGSTDDTVTIATACGARVIYQAWLGYGPQKQFAVNAATHDWVLCLDADERVDTELAQSIHAELYSPSATVYELPMQQRFMHRMLKYGHGYPLWKLRLFDRRSAHWSDDPIHESVRCSSPPKRLTGTLLHLPELTLAEWLSKQNTYTTLQAEQLFAKGKHVQIGQLIANPMWRFVKYYILKRGFLDGIPGLIHAVLNAVFVFIKYAKLWSMTRK